VTNHDQSLPQKLGIEAGMNVAVVNEPAGWLETLAPLPDRVRLFERASERLDVIVYFSDERANVERRVPAFAGFLARGGALWSAVPTDGDDLDPSVVADVARACGLTARATLEVAPGWIATRLEADQHSDATSG
jgi:hypothetical protein